MAIVIINQSEAYHTDYNGKITFSKKDLADYFDCDEDSLIIDNKCLRSAIVVSKVINGDDLYENILASDICKKPMFGKVMFMSGLEIEDDSYKTDENSLLESETFDDIFMNTYIKDATEKYFRSLKKESFVDIDKMISTISEKDLRITMNYFYTKLVSENIIHSADFILIETKDNIFKFSPETANEDVGKILKYFEDHEEYEKCAKLRDIKIF